MTSMTIKAYLYRSWEQDPIEIRRFTIEQDVAASYEYLLGKLRVVFPTLKEAVFDIYWEDEENDRISISTDEELFLAVSGLQSTVLKLYLRKKLTSEENNGRHFNKPFCFAGFNPWAGMYGPCGPFRSGQCPKRESEQQTTEKSDDNPFVLSADERECVQNIGGAVASFLKPYGINVDVGVAGIPKNEATASSESKTDDKTTTAQADQPWLPVVEQLKGMGFDDDGGWLTELVKAKNNDIHKVLDALNHGR